MIYFYAEDPMHYSDIAKEKLIKKYNIADIIAHPTYQDLRDTAGRNIAFMAPYLPIDFDRKMKNSNYFSVVELQNQHGVLTSSQKALGIDETEIMEQKFGISIYEPEETFASMGGADILKDYVNRVIAMESLNIKIKGIFLVGIPGTGKSFTAKCFAGETKRKLVELNLSVLMFQPNPIFALKQVFQFLSKQNAKFIIWIDEIEKQIVDDEKSQQVLGALLTILNDLGSSTSKFSVDAIFFATANNITSIAEKNPEFLRKGRFDELFFLNYPKPENAKSIFELYRKKTNKIVSEDLYYRLLFKRVNTKVGKITDTKIGTESSIAIERILDNVLVYAKDIYESIDDKITIAAHPNSHIVGGQLVHTEDKNEKPDPFSMSTKKQEFIISVFKKRFLEKFKDSAEFRETHENFFNRLKCDFDLEQMYQIPEIVHKDKIDSKLYIYTPSEIESYVREWFAFKVQHQNIDANLHTSIVKRLIPLQKSMREGIDKLVAQKEMFIEVS